MIPRAAHAGRAAAFVTQGARHDRTIHGIGVGRSIAIGRAVVIVPSSAGSSITSSSLPKWKTRLPGYCAPVTPAIQEVQLMLSTLPKDAPSELPALLDVHMMLLQDEEIFSGVRYWIADRLYNAGWALSNQFERLARQFDEMEDPYLRERKADLNR